MDRTHCRKEPVHREEEPWTCQILTPKPQDGVLARGVPLGGLSIKFLIFAV
jgi:hypothetical protein